MARDDQQDARSSEAVVEMPSTEAILDTRAPAGRAPLRGPAPPTEAPPIQLRLDDLAIDRGGEIPIGVQLAWALRARIGDGRLQPGQRLPGLRELAELLGINANTARAVYQRLEQEGLIDSRQGTGTFVASVPQEPSAVGQIAADAARQAHRTGVDPREVAAALYVSGEPPTSAATQAGERRRELRAQIAALEQTLSELQASHPGLIPPPGKPIRHAGPRLLSVEDLERVRAGLVRRLAAAEPLLEANALENKPAVETLGAGELDRQSDRPKREGATPDRKAARARPRTRPSTA